MRKVCITLENIYNKLSGSLKSKILDQKSIYVLEGNPSKCQVISEQNLLAYQLFCWFLQNLDSVFSTLLMLYWLDLLVFLAYKCHNLQMRPAETVGFVTTEKKNHICINFKGDSTDSPSLNTLSTRTFSKKVLNTK